MSRNDLIFKRVIKSPFLEPKTGTLAPDAVTTPDVLKFQERHFLYTGAVSGDKERIIYQPLPLEMIKTKQSLPISEQAKLVIEPGPLSFDDQHVFDPASVVVGDQVLLFYSAIGGGDDTIGMAFSPDGIHFDKRTAPLLVGRSPEVIQKDQYLFLYYVLRGLHQSYRIHTCRLTLSAEVLEEFSEPILDAGSPQAWDSFEVTTPRIFSRHGVYYMMYAGSNNPACKDHPIGFGLARSINMINWEKYPHNPVFKVGTPGSWDEGALWFGTVFEWDDNLYLLYEGGNAEHMQKPAPTLTSVGLAWISGKEFDRKIEFWK